jgi:DNA-binding MarR family transcriptional regulator
MKATSDIAKAYARLPRLGRLVLGCLLGSLPNVDGPSPLTLAGVQRRVGCSKASLLRHVARGEELGLFVRSKHDSGRRHGLLITPCLERCREFLAIFRKDAPEHCDQDRYQEDADLPFLSTSGRRVLGLIERCGRDSDVADIFLSHLARMANCSEPTARRTVNRAAVAGLLGKEAHPRGPRFGVRITFTDRDRLKRIAMTGPGDTDQLRRHDTKTDRYHGSKHGHSPARGDTKQDRYGTNQDRYHGPNPDRPTASRNNQSLTGLSGHSIYSSDTKTDRYHLQNDTIHDRYDTGHDQTDTNPDRYQDTKSDRYASAGEKPYPPKACDCSDTDQDWCQPSLLDRQIRNLSIWKNELLSLTRDECGILWPSLLSVGFGPDQIRQIVEHRLRLDLPLDDIMGSLHSAEWELADGHFPQTNKGVASYLFVTLRTKGTYRRLPGYVSPEQQALNNAKAALTARKEAEILHEKLAGEHKTKAFENWLQDLPPTQLAEIDRLNPYPKAKLKEDGTSPLVRGFRRAYWEQHVAVNAR